MAFNFATYYAADTPVHALDVRAKIVLLVVYSGVLFLVESWLGMGLLAAACVAAAVLAHLPVRQVLRQFAPVGVIMVATLLASWYSFSAGFTMEGFLRGLFYVVRIALLMGASLVFTTTSTSTQITQALESFLSPLERFGVPTRDIATVVSIALRFIPVTIDQFLAIRQAQVARGACFDTGKLVARLKTWATVFVPLFVSLYHRADVLASALDARAYGLAHATKLNRPTFTAASAAVMIAGVAFCVAVALAL